MIGLAAIVAVVVVSLHKGQAQQLAGLLRTMRPEWVVVAAGLQALTYACDAAIWRHILGRAGSPQPFPRMFGLSIARLFVRQAIPSGGLSGDVLLVKVLEKYDVPLEASMTALCFNLLGFYASFALCALLAAVILYAANALRGPLIAIAVPFCVIITAIPTLLLWLVRSGDRLKKSRLRKVPLLGKVIEAFGSARLDLLGDGRLMAWAAALQAATWAFDALTLAALLAALSSPVPIWGSFAAFMLASAAELVGPVPGGLGAFEGGCILGLRAFGVPVDTALVATLALRAFTFWLPMVPGVFVARWAIAPRPDAGPGPAEPAEREEGAAESPRRGDGTPEDPRPAHAETRASSAPDF